MMTRKALIMAALLCAIGARPGIGQDRVPLRAVHQGEFLPEETEVVVLTRNARIERGGRFQPEFFPASNFPRSAPDGLRKDRLDGAGRTSRRYPRTEISGDLYFLYALTPDSTLYWSFSAERDALKFDVVSSGVMSVAPVSDPEAARQVLGSLFGQRVIVQMPAAYDLGSDVATEQEAEHRNAADQGDAVEERNAADQGDAAERDSAAIPTGAAHGPVGFRLDGEGLAGAVDERSIGTSPNVGFTDPAPHVQSASGGGRPEHAGGGSVLTRGVGAWGLALLLLGLGGAAGAVLTARTYRREVRTLRVEIDKLRGALRRVAEIADPPPGR